MHVPCIFLLGVMLLNIADHHNTHRKALLEKNAAQLEAYDYEKYPLLEHLPIDLYTIVQSYAGSECSELSSSNAYSISAIAWSPDGNHIATGGYDGLVRLWHAATGKEIQIGSKDRGCVKSLAFSPDGKHLASGMSGWWVCLWGRDESGMFKEKYIFKDYCLSNDSVKFDPSSRYLASVTLNGYIHMFDCATGKKMCSYDTGPAGVSSAVFSRDGCFILYGDFKGFIHKWTPATGEKVHLYEAHQQWIDRLALSPSGQYLATVSGDNTVRIWDIESDNKLATSTLPHDKHVVSVAWDSEGKLLTSASSDGAVHIWDPKTGKKMQTLKLDCHDRIRATAFNPRDPRMVAFAEKKGLKVYRPLCLTPPVNNDKKTKKAVGE